ncbi:MAG: hypothetical protein FWF46_04905 [Oscillospiraceae bacterium]|nr:hypothetical protein [Oscillospiraceae bacterium]
MYYSPSGYYLTLFSKVASLSKRIVYVGANIVRPKYVGANIVRPKLEEFDKIIEKRDNYSAGRTMFAPTT